MHPEILDSSFFSPDILDFIRLLHKHEVEYMVVGGEAVIFYGHVRLTGDIDFFYRQSEENVRRLYAALDEFWQGNIPGIEDLLELRREGLILQFGLPPNRIDLLNAIDGIDFSRAWPERTIVEIQSAQGSIPLIYIGLADLLQNKTASGRAKDLDDLRFLGATHTPQASGN